MAVLRVGVPAEVARLGGVPGVHRDDFTSSFFRFVGDASQQLSPARSQDLTIQRSLGGCPVRVETSLNIRARRRTPHQIGDLQLFVNDHVVAVDESTRHLVSEIAALTSDPAMQSTAHAQQDVRAGEMPNCNTG